MSEEEEQQYKKETGKSPLYFNKPSNDFKKWLELKAEPDNVEEVIPEVIEEQKPTIPIDYYKIVEDFFRTPEYEKKYISPITNEIISEGLTYIPPFRIELKDLDNNILSLFRQDTKRFLKYLKEGLFNRLRFNPDVRDLFKLFDIKPKDLQIIPNAIDIENLIPKIIDLTLNKTKFINHFIIVEGRYLNSGIDKRRGFNSITFRCTFCESEFKRHYLNNIDDRIIYPNFCMKIKCKSKDFEKIDSDSFEIGFFMVDDLDFKRSGNYLSCIILDNIDYFIEEIKTINLGEDVEVLGILRINYSDLKTRKETQKFEYYLECFEIKPKKTKNFDESIIKVLEDKLNKNPSYFEKLIDSIHPLTYLIDIYYPIKLLNCMTYSTGGSWGRENHIRDTLNSIIIGPPSTYKSKIAESLEYIIGKRHFMVFECNDKMTSAGLIGTTQRDPTKTTPTVRYGILPLYSNGTIVLDEGHKMPLIVLDILRCLEKGDTGGLQDATLFEGPTKESVVISQNCVVNEDGSFKEDESIFKNIGWGDKNSRSRLERFDLLYVIPIPDTFIKIRTLDNEKRLSMRILLGEIATDLELDDYYFPKSMNTIEDKLQYLLYNYFHRAKGIYRKIQLAEEDKDSLRRIYREALFDKKDQFKTDTDVNMRSLNICYKILKSLSALRFSKKVNKSIFNYFKQKCMSLIIPFRDSLLIETKSINMDEVFKDTFRNIAKHEITLKVFVDEIRKYMKRIYYNDKSEEFFEEEIKDYITSEYSLKENYKFKKLLMNNEGWLKSQDYFIEYGGKGKGNVTTIKKMIGSSGDFRSTNRFTVEKIEMSNEEKIKLEKEIVEKIEEIFESNKFKALEEKSIRKNLELEFSEELIEKAFNYLWDKEVINPDENNDNLIYFKKENLLNLKLAGVGGEQEKGDI